MKSEATTIEQAQCLRVLQSTAEPMTAAQLAARLHLGGCRESRRRHVRGIVKSLRDSGAHIVATLQGGYWLTDDDTLWRDYLEGRQIDAKQVLGETHKRKRMLADKQGQGLLFITRQPVGCASVGIG